MKLAFHGAARMVTGSKHLITLKNGKKILLDCGLFQGMGKETDPLNRDFGFDPSSIDVMILSHAHIDHSGLLPKLVKDGYNGPVFCTPATSELAAVLLEDAGDIQENDIKYSNKKRKAQGEPLLQPLFSAADALKCAGLFVAKDYDQWFTVTDGVEALFTDAGHIIGSACVHLRITEDGRQYRITYSGDVGPNREMILRQPECYPQADYIIIESTYGNSLHEDITSRVNTLLHWIEKTCIKKKGKLILPAFALGRTQEILYALNQLELEGRLPPVDYFVDSPLSITVTKLVKRYPHYFNDTIQKILETDKDPFHFKGLRLIESVQESKLLNYRNDPCMIIASSGMAEAGRVKHHVRNNVENSHNSILMTGYCEPNSLGGRLLAGHDEVSIFGVRHEVHAEVGMIKSMSAHGDYEDLIQWLSCQDASVVKKIFLVHGEYDVQQNFKDRLQTKGYKVEIPGLHYEVEL